ncbi:peptide ABC transporter substrate-binding protein [Micromonospora qiuiae]|uniref:Peptide ABC transporter substrate-binding protein n=1 Tax=Micromonospora qiuiae TaxID=502268 RepID=A0ABQ4JG15_9ACTN|nr:ABC transporter substrate-binding protein [Micromonospora qiuiae]GIJ29378.1 peptide ABC transporter substrate-binding protein [Micromonospora qiuiae]
MDEYIVVVPEGTTEINESYRNVVGGAGYFVANNIFSRLIVTEVGGAASYPDLAEHWECLDGARRWRFTLNRHARWHDGQPVTAHDVAYTHLTALANGYHAASFLHGIADIKVLDDHLVEYHLTEPNAAFLTQLGNFAATHVLPKHLYEGTDWATNPYNQKPVGSGPFRFVEMEPGGRIVLEAWDGYWGPPAGVDRVTIVVEPDLDECVRMIADGRAHFAPQDVLTMKRLPLAEGSAHATVYRERGPGVALLSFNYRQERWADRRLRLAIAHAVDRSRLERFAEPGWSEPWANFFPGSSFAVARDVTAPGHDAAAAEKLLDEAGYPRGADGRRLSLRMFYMATFDGHGGLARSVAEDLAAIGVHVEYRGLDSETWARQIGREGDFDLTISGGNMMPDPDITASRLQGGGQRNHLALANPDADACYIAARSTTDHAERIAHYRRLQEVWARDVNVIPLFWYCIYLLRSNEFFGWADQVDFRIPFWHWGRLRKITGGES